MEEGISAFMMMCVMLVLLMTPGLAFFYGGLSRRKNVGNTMIMVFAAIGVAAITWTMIGWSIAYGGSGEDPLFGGFDQLMLMGSMEFALPEADAQSAGTYPQLIDVVFQMAFCMITTAIITGGVAGRMRFGAVVAFLFLWTVVVYPVLAHMVWGGEASLIGGMIGALDFAGGDVVHISSGLTALILCILCGKRKGFGAMSYRPHNVPFVALGAALLWFGWFGFNAGSAFAPDGVAALALVNTVCASGAGIISWMIVERITVKKPTLIGACTGLVAGLVVITPAAGFVESWAALLMGLLASPVCYLAISHAKRLLGYDDALDAFGCHCVGGILGGVLTGIFCVPELSWTEFGGLIYTGDPTLLGAQILGIVVTIAFVGVLDIIIGLILKACYKGSLRVSDEAEALGLDISEHGESAYPAYIGLD